MKQPLAVLCLIICTSISAQNKLSVGFKTSVDTIYSKNDDGVYLIKVSLHKGQQKHKGANIKINFEKNDLSPLEVWMPVENSFTLDGGDSESLKEFAVRFKRSEDHDRMMIFKLVASDKDGKALEIEGNSIVKVYIERSDTPKIKQNGQGAEFWLFTGTNFDLLDGVKAKELYFKASYFFDLNPKTNSRSSVLINFGKNRYTSRQDTATNVMFSHLLPNANLNDSSRKVTGFYNTRSETVTENIFSSIDYLYKLKSLSSDISHLYVNLGVYFGLQNLKTKYNNSIIDTDTTQIMAAGNMFRPIADESNIKQYNYNFGIGVAHILSTDKLNIKSQVLVGYNRAVYPRSIVKIGIYENITLMPTNQFFTQIRLDATVLNPGLSIGFETLLRPGHFPLYNVNLTKVIDITKLGVLFGSLPTAN